VLAILPNLGFQELTIIAAVAVLVFGKRLPEVAARAYAQLARLRHSLEDLRRETGIDRELRNIEYEVRDAARKGKLANPLLPPQGLRAARSPQPDPEAGPADEEEPAPREPRAEEVVDRRELG